MSDNQLGANLASLPSDDTTVNPTENNVLDTIFETKGEDIKKLGKNLKIPLLIGVFFFVFGLPMSSGLFDKLLGSYKESPYIMLMFKTFIFTLIAFLIYYWFTPSN